MPCARDIRTEPADNAEALERHESSAPHDGPKNASDTRISEIADQLGALLVRATARRLRTSYVSVMHTCWKYQWNRINLRYSFI